jgi:hypothetical protein
MTIIKIDRSTIKRNENAGMETTCMPGLTTGRFSLSKSIPDWLLKPVRTEYGIECPDGIIVNEWQADEDGKVIYASGVIEGPEAAQIFDGIDGAEIAFTTERIRFDHTPIPEYSYRYEDPSIPCSSCGKETLLSQIPERQGIDDDYQYCPHCDEYEPFQYTYEKFDRSMVAV